MTVLDKLKEIKRASDVRDYMRKHHLARRLMKEFPKDFKIDSDHPTHPGITHTPTHFRFHMPKGLIPKLGVVMEGLKPYQQRTVDRIQRPDQPGLVVAHGTGTGKTRQSIEAYKQLGMPATVVVPAALQANYQKEMNKWVGKVPSNVNIISQQAVARQGLPPNNGLLVVDEAHRARNNQSSLMAALKDNTAQKRLALTATPSYNHPADLSTLVNFAAGRTVLPEDRNKYDERYVNYKKVNPGFIPRLMGVKPGVVPELKNTPELKKIYNKWVDYYGGSEEGFPSSREEQINVPMGSNQQEIYKTIMGQAPAWLRWKVKLGLPPGKGELDKMRAFLGGARQVSNTTQGFVKDPAKVESAKVDKAFGYLQKQLAANPRYKAVVYSNYLNSGLSPYKQRLEQAGVPYGEFSGAVSPRIRNQMVQDYNANKLRALLVSSAGSEGLDLKGTRLIQIMEPHFNEEKEKQIIGRGIRYRSHDALPEDERNVLVQRYLAQPQASLLDRFLGNKKVTGADEYIRNTALQKTLLTRQVLNLLNEQNKGLKNYAQ